MRICWSADNSSQNFGGQVEVYCFWLLLIKAVQMTVRTLAGELPIEVQIGFRFLFRVEQYLVSYDVARVH